MEIVTYPHPALRHKSKPIVRVDDELVQVVRDMFKLMYAAKGVGLAANQVNLPIRLFVANTTATEGEGEEMVFINPVISRPKGIAEAEEGCLSLPGLYGSLKRPKQINVNAYNLQGEEISATLTGFLSRVVQHETDHLDGVMFIDRMSETAAADIAPQVEEFELAYRSERQSGEPGFEEGVAEHLAAWEKKYCE